MARHGTGGTGTVGLPWVALQAFLRLSTRPGLLPRPLTVVKATSVVEAWLAQPAGVIPEPTARHVGILGDLLPEAGTGGNLVTDAHLAALAVEHAATIVTWDRDFSRFPGVRVEQP